LCTPPTDLTRLVIYRFGCTERQAYILSAALLRHKAEVPNAVNKLEELRTKNIQRPGSSKLEIKTTDTKT